MIVGLFLSDTCINKIVKNLLINRIIILQLKCNKDTIYGHLNSEKVKNLLINS